MKYYFIAGEASGDLHAGNCMREIKKLDPSAVFAFTGGGLMEAVSGVSADINIRQMAFMGFVNVLLHIRTIKKNFDIVKAAILKFKPDVLVLVDYPGFNLRMAKWATQMGIKVDYYISPTVWAWKENRVEQIRQFTNKLFVILPFEEAFYQKHQHKVYFVGHPLLDAIEQQKPRFRPKATFVSENGLSGKPLIAVLPGSRVQEIERMLHIMLQVIPEFNDYEFVVAGSSNLPASRYEALKQHGIKVVYNQTYELMKHAEAGVIKSGTSTLESALMRLPQVVCYKMAKLNYIIGKQVVKIKYISLVNLIMDKLIVKELIQDELNSENIAKELRLLLKDATYRSAMLDQYDQLIHHLGGPGASARLAAHLVEDAKMNK